MKRNKKVTTLCVVFNGTHILLGMKKRGFGKGKWNGFGGKLYENESIDEAAYREIQEEVGIIPESLRKQAIFTFLGEAEDDIEVHVFRVREFTGEPTESEEMKPRWFPHEEIPFHDMWPDDKHWLPLFLAGKKLKGTFLFKQDKIVNFLINEVEKL